MKDEVRDLISKLDVLQDKVRYGAPWQLNWRDDPEAPGSIHCSGFAIAMCPRYGGPKHDGSFENDANFIIALNNNYSVLRDELKRLSVQLEKIERIISKEVKG